MKIFLLVLFTSVKAEFDIGCAISDGFIHAAVSDVVKEPIQNAINPTFEPYYICTDKTTVLDTNKEKCQVYVLDYVVVIPPNPLVLFLVYMCIILIFISTIVWCFVSSCEDKVDMFAYFCCHIIGIIIYDILFGEEDD